MAETRPPSPSNKRVKLLELKRCVIFNPVARGEKARQLQSHLSALHNCKLIPTTGPGTARGLAREAALAGFKTIVAAGGDGTLNEVSNGIIDSGVPCNFGIVPFGTANVFARELKIPLLNFSRAWQIIEAGKTIAVDFPIAEWGLTGSTQTRGFVQIAGVGLDARAVELMDWTLKKKIGFAAYLVAGAKAMSETKPNLLVRAGEQLHYAEAVLVGNGCLYAGDFCIFPGAKLNDGLLDILLIPKLDWFSAACLAGTYFSDQFASWRGMKSIRSNQVEITSSQPAPFQLDGDLISSIPVRFSVPDPKLNVLVP